MRVRFGTFVFDEPSRELTSHGRRIPLSPKAFELLATLLHERPRAFSKAELREQLWPGVYVGETSLPRVVGEVRQALGDRRAEDFVRTVHRFGYAFVANATDASTRESAASSLETGLALLWGERIIPLSDGENVLGRDRDCVVRVPSGLASRRHAVIVVSGERATLRDLGSRNGTLLRGRRLERPEELNDGDEIRIGPALVVFCRPAAGTTRSRG
jgi:DNA-binding winged helix-turn-helix (wHTH) protein